MNSTQPIDLFRDQTVEARAILEAQARASVAFTERVRRAERRRLHPKLATVLSVQEGASTLNFNVLTIDISDTGIGVLHGKFVAPGTNAVLILGLAEGKGIRINARVRRCEHRAGRIHEIGMQFLKPIDSLKFTCPVGTDPELDYNAIGQHALDLADAARRNADLNELKQRLIELNQLLNPPRAA